MKLFNFYTQFASERHVGGVMRGRAVDLTAAFPGDPPFASVSALLRAGRDAMRRARQRVAEDSSGAMAAATPDLDGEVRQSFNTKQLVFKPAALLSVLSQTLTLEAGDVISTGTPGGIGYYAHPRIFLKQGDVVEVEVEDIGALRNSVTKQQEMHDGSGKGRRR